MNVFSLAVLEQQITTLSNDRPWQEWNASRALALRRLDASGIRPFDLIACLSKGIRDLQGATRMDLYQFETRRINDYESPFIFSDISYHPESLQNIPAPAGSYVLPSCDHPPT